MKSLYVGNLPYSVGEKELFDFFEAYSPQSVRIVEGRGFGFVDVPEEQMEAAIEGTNGREMGGRKLIVNEARPRSAGGDRGDRGDRGGRSRR